MDADPSGFRRSCPRRSGRTALPPAACPPVSRDSGRAAAGRAGSFNSGKNLFGFNFETQTSCPSGTRLRANKGTGLQNRPSEASEEMGDSGEEEDDGEGGEDSADDAAWDEEEEEYDRKRQREKSQSY